MQTAKENTWASAGSHFPERAENRTGAEYEESRTRPVPIDSEALSRPSGLEKLVIQGGNSLEGKIAVSGAKNAALKLMCASLLTGEAVQLRNMPVFLGDIRTQAAVLQHIGVRVALRSDGFAYLNAETITNPEAPYDLVRKMRASILVLGPLLARYGEAVVSLPGGCAIGTRPVDYHIQGLKALGAEIEIENGYIYARAPKGLKGVEYTFPQVSHTGTENLMMAATLAKGTTVLNNAAREPEVLDLGHCLISMGAEIEGLGTNTITIHGKSMLNGITHDVMSDRIETGTWLIAVGLCGGEITLEKTSLEYLGALMRPLSEAGVHFEEDRESNSIRAWRNGRRLKGIDVMTEPYPGFATDLQAQMTTMLCVSEGAGMVTETIFENRFMHVPELSRMGANIRVQGNSAIVRGVEKLTGTEVMATDLRASVALVLAGLVAEGETVVNRIYHLDRGYENIVEKLKNLGVEAKRLRGG